ncbi:uncharacterized protein FOMMEDRAFT_153776 [Fomitiporia mediterranea MF3/22]|uniref:uncharacterized protein n=1 Tax=Fomitiporia mediterranea (strain MF3/22) TaxID=694068 RepID=UPI00044096BD|nr:uncharacterized protein FOMMEDRAFT_153776 [Fomitiporia mediterranea MF3/22]EJD04704.1 hypothetical protein FOMMEDRAFT_153776 [Fomitiporia mediterranea MF3/22]
MASLAAQISLFNAPDPNLGAPLTLAARCHSTASASTTCSTSIHTRTQFNLQGPSDDQSVVMKTTSNGPRTHPSSSVADAVGKRTRREAAHHTLQVLKFDSLSADSSLYGCPFGYPHTTCSSDGSTADAVITVEPLNALAFWWSVWIWSRDGPGNRHP